MCVDYFVVDVFMVIFLGVVVYCGWFGFEGVGFVVGLDVCVVCCEVVLFGILGLFLLFFVVFGLGFVVVVVFYLLVVSILVDLCGGFGVVLGGVLFVFFFLVVLFLFLGCVFGVVFFVVVKSYCCFFLDCVKVYYKFLYLKLYLWMYIGECFFVCDW